ncbi:3-oxoacyl-ACP reductase FabG [Natronorarus salvus]|uniref:3-oxoacyl-ACP reductase FabG n=1 Tax=Natronorarus salvus TaxID=3117733 RepID=UPI002F26259B
MNSHQLCVVTGASKGIGRATVEALAGEKRTVVVNYRRSEAGAYDAVAAIEDAGGTAVAMQADVTDPAAVEGMRDRVHERIGPVDVLVNNAGVTADTTFGRMDREDWERVIDVTLNGTFACTKAFFDDIKSSPQGRLINVSSVIGKQGNYGQANYAAAKSGLFGFTRTLALELAESGSTANCVAPGYTDTEMVRAVPEDIQDRIREEIPIGRFATAGEVAELIAFLASPHASYITGETIDITGGLDL